MAGWKPLSAGDSEGVGCTRACMQQSASSPEFVWRQLASEGLVDGLRRCGCGCGCGVVLPVPRR